MRPRPDWMEPADERVLEFLEIQDIAATPEGVHHNLVERRGTVEASPAAVEKRLRELADRNLLRRVGPEGRLYELTGPGYAYLRGSLDSGDLAAVERGDDPTARPPAASATGAEDAGAAVPAVIGVLGILAVLAALYGAAALLGWVGRLAVDALAGLLAGPTPVPGPGWAAGVPGPVYPLAGLALVYLLAEALASLAARERLVLAGVVLGMARQLRLAARSRRRPPTDGRD